MPVELVSTDRDTPPLLTPNVQDYLPEDHLSRFVMEVVDQLDMGALPGAYVGKDKKPCQSAILAKTGTEK